MFFGIALCFCAMTQAAQAQATRTWVASTGDDANPCTRSTPCKTFSGAYSKTAVGGEIDTVDPSAYGPLTITHAITVDGGSAEVAETVAAGFNAFTVNAGPNDRVVLRNLGLNGVNQSAAAGTNGILFNSGGALAVEHCVIEGFGTYGINFQPAVRAFLTVSDSVLVGNGSFGLASGTGGLIASTSAGTGGVNRISIVRTVISEGTSGITAGQNTKVELEHSTIGQTGLGGGGYGVTANGSTAEVSIDFSTISGNNFGGLHATNGAKMYVANSSITYNNTNGILSDTGGQVLSYGNNHVAGNTGSSTFFAVIPQT
jgi:hypothetical protein